MSECIPLEVQVEVIKRLPVKSFVQFRSVSKSWKSVIDTSDFIASYKARQTHPQRLLVWYKDPVDTMEKYVSFVDVDAYAQQKFVRTIPKLCKLLDDLEMVGSSQGLLCLYGYNRDPRHPRYNVATEMAVLWNPSVRKSVCITLPDMLDLSETVLGFGVSPITNDPTIVTITNGSVHDETEVSASVIKVYTLSSGIWRIPSSNLPKKSIKVIRSQVVIDSFIYWVAYDNEFQMLKHLIISFDMTTEEFGVIDLPENLAYYSLGRVTLSISKVGDSLAVLEYVTYNHLQGPQSDEGCAVWIMDHAVPNSFTKLFTVNTPIGSLICASLKILGFTKIGEAIMETSDDYREPASLAVYEPCSEHFNDIGIFGEFGSSFVDSYMETLILLDKLDRSVLF